MLYKLVDEDDDGNLTAYEMAEFLRQWAPPMSMRKLLGTVEAMFNALDPDKTGKRARSQYGRVESAACLPRLDHAQLNLAEGASAGSSS